jgi:hypothetical protein
VMDRRGAIIVMHVSYRGIQRLDSANQTIHLLLQPRTSDASQNHNSATM